MCRFFSQPLLQTLKRVVFLLSACLALVFSPGVLAQGYPSKPVTIVIMLAPGTGMDVIVRSYAEKLSQSLGKPVVVDNKPGGSAIVAVNAVLGAPADGHTLLVATSGAFAINQVVFKKLSYDPINDFTPVSLYLKSPFILVVKPSLPAQSVAELIAYARANAGKLSYSSPGAATAPQLAVEMMKSRFGLDITHIPYKSSPQSISDIVAGTIDLGFVEAGASFQLIKGGKLRPLAVSSLVRLTSFTDIAPFAEVSGVADFEAVSWHVLSARSGTPRPILDRLHEEMNRAIKAQDIQQRMINLGLIPLDPPSIEDTEKYIKAEAGKWGTLVKQIGAAGTQ